MNNECMHNPNIQMQTGPLPADSLHNEHGCDQNLLLWGGKQLAGGLTIPDKESPKRYPNGMSVVTVVGHSRLHMRNTSCSSSSWYWPLRPIREEPIQSYTLKTGSVLDTGESRAEGSKHTVKKILDHGPTRTGLPGSIRLDLVFRPVDSHPVLTGKKPSYIGKFKNKT